MAKNYNDTPTIEDKLGRKKWSDSIIQQIKVSEAPKVMAIHGTWGTGKTSAMAYMYTQLGGRLFSKKKLFKKDIDKNFQPIWFEAWQYQHEENILAALLKEIRDQLVFRYKFLNVLDEGLTVGLTSILQSIDLTFESFGVKFGFKDFAKNVRDNVKEYERERFAEPLNSAMMKNMLQEAINQLLKLDSLVKGRNSKAKSKAVIFIDDLDRCEPEVAYRILESIKVYLDLDNCIFVIGMDIHSVERMLAKHYQKQFDSKDDFKDLENISRLYIEKICQDVYHIPILTEKLKVAYLEELLSGKDCNVDILNIIQTIATKFNFLPPFPRSIKIFVNILLTHIEKPTINRFITEDEKKQNNNIQQLIIISYLYAFHYELYSLIYSYKNFYNHSFLTFCKNPFEYSVEKGEHPTLKSLIIPFNQESAKALAKGKDDNEIRNKILSSIYPHANLRQVLWIKELIVSFGSITEESLNLLKL